MTPGHQVSPAAPAADFGRMTPSASDPSPRPSCTRIEQGVIAGALLTAAALGSCLCFGFGASLSGSSPPRGVAIVFLAAAFSLARWGGRLGRTLAWPFLVAGPALALGVAVRGFRASTTPWAFEDGLVDPETGRMGLSLSLPVAIFFAVTAGILSLELLGLARRIRWRRAAMLFSVALVAICVVVAVGRANGFSVLVVNGESLTLIGSMAVGLLNLAAAVAYGLWPESLAAIRGRPLNARTSVTPAEERTHHLLLAALATTVVMATAIAYSGLRYLVQKQRAELSLDLTSVLEEKDGQIEAWREERRADLRVLMQAPLMRESLTALTLNPQLSASDLPLGEFTKEFLGAYGYDTIALLDARGIPLWTAPSEALTVTLPSAALREALRRTEGEAVDELHRTPDGRVWFDLIAPVRNSAGQGMVGAIFLRVDPRRRLFPMVQKWLSTRKTPEILLVRRDSDSVLFLSPVRDRPDAEVSFRLPLATPNLLAAEAVRGEVTNPREAQDYGGRRVLGAAHPVPGSSWVLVAKIDLSELYGPVRADAWRAGAALGGILLAAGLVGGGFWHRRQFQHVRQRWIDDQGRHAAIERLGLVMRHANDIILIFDEQMRIVEGNERAESAYGRPVAELRSLTAGDLRAARGQAGLAADFAAALQSSHVFETTHRHRDGREFPVEVSSQPVLIEGRPHVLSIIRDTSERNAHLGEIERLGRMYQAVSQVNQALVRATNRLELLQDVCAAMVGSGLFKVAWAGWLNEESRRLMPLAVAGDHSAYPEEINVSADAEVDGSSGPVGTAFREARPVVANNFRAGTTALPWKNRNSMHSVLALPIREAGRPVGVLVVYAAEADFFQAREIALLEEAAGDVSFALDLFAREALRRETEDALATSRRRMEFLLSATPAVLYTRRAGDSAITFVSPNAHRITGWPASGFELDPGLWLERVHPGDRDALLAGFAAIGPGQATSFEYRLRRPDGTYRWIHDEISSAIDEQGRLQEYVGFWSDITARREAEHALHEREQLLTLVFNQMLDSIVLYDLSAQRFTEFNPAAHRNLGYSREEFAQLSIPDIDVGLTPEQLGEALQLFASPAGGVMETKHRGKDGSIRDVRVGARKATMGGRDYLVTLWSDVTEQRKMAEAIRISEERHRALFENMDLGVVYHDAAGAITTANPAAEHILGLSLAAMQGLTSTAPIWRALREDGTTFAGEEHPAMVALRTGARVNGVVMGVQSGNRPEVRWLLVDAVPEVRRGETKPHRVFAIFNDITARREAEAELRKLSTAVEQSPAAVFITDLRGRIEYVNRRFTELTGYTLADCKDRNPRFLQSGLTPGHTYADLWRRILDGQLWQGEMVNRKKNGEIFTVLLRIAPVKDADGRNTHYLAINEDISERKRADAELRRTLQGLRVLNEVARVLERRDFSVAELGRVVATALVGLTEPPGILQAVVEIGGERQSAGAEGSRVAEICAGVTINERPAGQIILGCVRWPGGAPEEVFRGQETALLENLARMIGLGLAEREAFASVQRFNSELEDKVGQRTAELAARTREIEALLDAIPDLVLRVNQTGTLLDCQPAKGATRLAGLACPAPCSLAVLPPSLQEAVLASGREALAKEGTHFAEADVVLSEAGSFAAEVRSTTVGPGQFVAFVRDITERKQAEAEASGRLEQERQVSEMKSRFISVTSHEFRTPIATVMGTVELLRGHLDRIAPAKREEMFARIMGALHRMTEMLDDLLQLNRIDAGRTRVQLAPANLRLLLESLVEEARAGDRSAHEFVWRWNSEAAEATTDAQLLHHIFSNLLSNAARYSPPGTVIAVTGTVGPEGIRLTVEDRGIGIPPADRERVFEPFERGSNVGAIAGTGLGLSIVKRMTELLGGTVRVEPVEPSGSRFILELPGDPVQRP